MGNNDARIGGLAAVFIAVAYLVAIPYFVVYVDYPSLTDPTAKLALLAEHYSSMYAMHVLVYELVAVALVVLTLALHERCRAKAGIIATFAAAIGLTWSALLLASSMVFNYGMGVSLRLSEAAPERAVWMWQVVEAVAQGIGGAGGELLGGLWTLFVSLAARAADALPSAPVRLGLVIGVTGLASCIPVLRNLGIAFGLLQIVWFAWVGAILLRTPHGERLAHPVAM